MPPSALDALKMMPYQVRGPAHGVGCALQAIRGGVLARPAVAALLATSRTDIVRPSGTLAYSRRCAAGTQCSVLPFAAFDTGCERQAAAANAYRGWQHAGQHSRANVADHGCCRSDICPGRFTPPRFINWAMHAGPMAFLVSGGRAATAFQHARGLPAQAKIVRRFKFTGASR